MQFIGKSKIGRLRAKNIDYPQLRLPPLYSRTIGDVVSVFETEHEEKQAFLIVTGHSVPPRRHGFKTVRESFKTVHRCSTDFTGHPVQKSIGFHATIRRREQLKKHRRKL